MEQEISKQLIDTLLSDSGISTIVYLNCAILIISLVVATLSVRFHSRVVDKFLGREDELRIDFRKFVDGVNSNLCTLSQGIKTLIEEHRDRKHEAERIADLINKK